MEERKEMEYWKKFKMVDKLVFIMDNLKIIKNMVKEQ